MKKIIAMLFVLSVLALLVGCAKAPSKTMVESDTGVDQSVSTIEQDVSEIDALEAELDTTELDELEQDLAELETLDFE